MADGSSAVLWLLVVAQMRSRNPLTRNVKNNNIARLPLRARFSWKSNIPIGTITPCKYTYNIGRYPGLSGILNTILLF